MDSKSRERHQRYTSDQFKSQAEMTKGSNEDLMNVTQGTENLTIQSNRLGKPVFDHNTNQSFEYQRPSKEVRDQSLKKLQQLFSQTKQKSRDETFKNKYGTRF